MGNNHTILSFAAAKDILTTVVHIDHENISSEALSFQDRAVI